MPVWDLAARENWQLILSEQRLAKNITKITASSYTYEPIPALFATLYNPVVLVGTYSVKAKSHWFLGARVSQYLYVSPSQNGNFISGVQVSDIKKVGLNRLTLVKFENYEVLPYVLAIEIPYWLEDIYVEVWEYEGNVVTPEMQELESIRAQLYDLEDKINTAYGQ